MKELSNVEIWQLCRKYGIHLNRIYSRDEIPYNLSKGWYIFNLDKADNEGTHWVCGYYAGHGNSGNLYFDSFGFIPPQHLSNIFGSYVYNNRKIQSLESSSCGWFCLMCINVCEHTKPENTNTSFNKFLKYFSINSDRNEKILADYFFDLHK